MAFPCSIQIRKRGGYTESFEYTKIKTRLRMAFGPRETTDYEDVMIETLVTMIESKLEGETDSRDLDRLAVSTAISLENFEPGYGIIATNIELDWLYRHTEAKFSAAMEKASKLLCPDFLDLVSRYKDIIDRMVDVTRDELLGHASIRILRDRYLLHDGYVIYERPQYMFLRVALVIHGTDMDAVSRSYEMQSRLQYIHSSATLINSGRPVPQLSTSFMLSAHPDPDDLFLTMTSVARIIRQNGGVGLSIGNIPSTGVIINGVERTGIVPVLRLLNSALDIFHLGDSNNAVHITVYLEPWHADIVHLIQTLRFGGLEENLKKTRTAIWTNDIFMRRVENNEEWTLFCPSKAAHLLDLYGPEFENEYQRLESNGIGKETINARTLWRQIMECIQEIGSPCILFKEAINVRSNDKHLGTSHQAGNSADVAQRATPDEHAVCASAFIVLPSYVRGPLNFDFSLMEHVIRHLVFTLNRLLIKSYPPTREAEVSIYRNRAISIGVQGMADTLSLMGISYDSDQARLFNMQLAETIYYVAMDKSANLTPLFGIYPHFKGSPISQGMLQFDHYNVETDTRRHDWASLRRKPNPAQKICLWGHQCCDEQDPR
ncbi:hypothetical protein H1R20_g15015, partial [Candolleomyces eurysporus]